uniref:(northern house mosquito) hypothetical protein n=1 Tax=Culex pipiens TaxID=7175 RepID=A0A8D8F292_CULPI
MIYIFAGLARYIVTLSRDLSAGCGRGHWRQGRCTGWDVPFQIAFGGVCLLNVVVVVTDRVVFIADEGGVTPGLVCCRLCPHRRRRGLVVFFQHQLRGQRRRGWQHRRRRHCYFYQFVTRPWRCRLLQAGGTCPCHRISLN